MKYNILEFEEYLGLGLSSHTYRGQRNFIKLNVPIIGELLKENNLAYE